MSPCPIPTTITITPRAPPKVDVIRAMPVPKTVKEIRGFIGAIGYYRRFIPAFSRLAGPLISLTKKCARFRWMEDCSMHLRP